MKKILLLFLLSFFVIDFTNACTTFVLKDSTHLVYGRNFDWDIGSGLIVINRKGIVKQAFVQPPNKPANWISKYGSITFNQIGVDAPMGGMNEKGLVIAQMGLFESEFPKTDDKYVVGGLEWIQYQLDNSSTLSEVIENNKKIRIVSNIVPDIIAIANSKINNYKTTSNNNPIDYSFEILNTVGSNTRTQWSIVFDIKNRTINFNTLSNRNIRTLDLNSFEYTCNNDIQILDIKKSNNETDLMKQFTNLTFDYYYDYKKNLIALYKANMKGFPDIPDEIIKLEVEYAINRKCE
jgi:penicillin V acylase-like amidase (Ntn superfamily)